LVFGGLIKEGLDFFEVGFGLLVKFFFHYYLVLPSFKGRRRIINPNLHPVIATDLLSPFIVIVLLYISSLTEAVDTKLNSIIYQFFIPFSSETTKDYPVPSKNFTDSFGNFLFGYYTGTRLGFVGEFRIKASFWFLG